MILTNVSEEESLINCQLRRISLLENWRLMTAEVHQTKKPRKTKLEL